MLEKSFEEFMSKIKGERLVEYPFMFKRIKRDWLILDVGCLESNLDVWLTKHEFSVIGIDVRKPFHEVGEFIRCDARFLPFREKVFDMAIAISTIEHIGLLHYGFEKYGEKALDLEGDRKALLELARVSRKQIITLPYGSGSFEWQRIYNENSLRRLLEGFEVETKEFYRYENDNWIPCSPNEIPKSVGFTKGIVCLTLKEKIKETDKRIV